MIEQQYSCTESILCPKYRTGTTSLLSFWPYY